MRKRVVNIDSVGHHHFDLERYFQERIRKYNQLVEKYEHLRNDTNPGFSYSFQEAKNMLPEIEKLGKELERLENAMVMKSAKGRL